MDIFSSANIAFLPTHIPRQESISFLQVVFAFLSYLIITIADVELFDIATLDEFVETPLNRRLGECRAVFSFEVDENRFLWERESAVSQRLQDEIPALLNSHFVHGVLTPSYYIRMCSVVDKTTHLPSKVGNWMVSRSRARGGLAL